MLIYLKLSEFVVEVLIFTIITQDFNYVMETVKEDSWEHRVRDHGSHSPSKEHGRGDWTGNTMCHLQYLVVQFYIT